jgi:hypothetical protein
MNRYAILLGKVPPPSPAPKEFPKCYLGMDVSYSIRENAIVITHMEKDKIIIDYAYHGQAFHMDAIIKRAEDLIKKYSIRQGIVDDPNMAKILGLNFVPSINSEMRSIFGSNLDKIHASDSCISQNRNLQSVPSVLNYSDDMTDALIRSVWLTVKNCLNKDIKCLNSR